MGCHEVGRTRSERLGFLGCFSLTCTLSIYLTALVANSLKNKVLNQYASPPVATSL